ncbi:hypothetical protein WA026_022564 [Henosepilachna vigintioctopunctata]|uniref:Small nuclear ribonucleoprotein Sm D2 n=1 Tax=Henosepilachna vigintioctopunctata TaxID=420089 RepID=A0AAW1VGX1_9CUCU
MTSAQVPKETLTDFQVGPLSVLYDSVQNNVQVLINCRNNKKLLGTVKCFDRHMNMIMENTREIWTEESRKSNGKKKKPIYKDRFLKKLFVRGDSVTLVLKNPLFKKNE